VKKKTISSPPNDPILISYEGPKGAPQKIAIPTKSQMINMGLILLAFPSRIAAGSTGDAGKIAGWEKDHIYKLHAIAPFVRRLLFERGVKWKKFNASQADRRQNRRLLAQYIQDGEIEA
jgi:hypothetical protein